MTSKIFDQNYKRTVGESFVSQPIILETEVTSWLDEMIKWGLLDTERTFFSTQQNNHNYSIPLYTQTQKLLPHVGEQKLLTIFPETKRIKTRETLQKISTWCEEIITEGTKFFNPTTQPKQIGLFTILQLADTIQRPENKFYATLSELKIPYDIMLGVLKLPTNIIIDEIKIWEKTSPTFLRTLLTEHQPHPKKNF